ncbi:hypothetical protein BU26DRAFT_334151 [Trematosphaeria pertusa]|uniref:Mediator of RNA polymerase II transcription subunit 20 n=1 Tax=Trematosphaeria pertusa TaxID=390896 RepID=A0A6A6IDH1_9PLEO|nr:uncharacterized protein BU26DRAFT_334151 [Trematosphaeria pertusa]KAF2248441.1 hypothetical protein BU26DRAFT_334151 [Trematosphaeria pertusa]
MKYSGLYFISNPGASLDASLNTVRSIVDGIESNMRTATQQAKWTLNHRLLRSTVPPPSKQNGDDARPPQPPSSQHQYSYQHLLTLSYLSQNRTYNYIHTPPLQNSQNPGASQDAPAGSSTGTDMAIPSQQADTHYDLLVTQWAQLWTPRRVLDLPNGITYTVSNFTIYVGELRAQRQGPQSSGVLSPGVVVCISTTAGDPVWDDESGVDDSTFPAANDDGFDYGDYDLSSARDMIREVWRIIREGKDFGKAEIRESFMDEKDFCAGKERAREAEVRMWCEALRQRG